MAHKLMRVSVLALALLAAACADRPAPTPAPPPVVQLNGTQWIAAEGGLNAPTIEFMESRANGFTGCNRFFAQVDQNGPGIAFSGISSTRRACSPDLMALERNFVARLNGARIAQIEGDTLVLADVNHVEIARFNRQ